MYLESADEPAEVACSTDTPSVAGRLLQPTHLPPSGRPRFILSEGSTHILSLCMVGRHVATCCRMRRCKPRGGAAGTEGVGQRNRGATAGTGSAGAIRKPARGLQSTGGAPICHFSSVLTFVTRCSGQSPGIASCTCTLSWSSVSPCIPCNFRPDHLPVSFTCETRGPA